MSDQTLDEQPAIAAAVIVHDRRVLLVQRQVSEGALLWQFPSGAVEHDEDPSDAAARETREETGLIVAPSSTLGERIHPNTGRRMIYIACDLLAGEVHHVADNEELAKYEWCAWEQLPKLVPHGFFAPVQEYLNRAMDVPMSPYEYEQQLNNWSQILGGLWPAWVATAQQLERPPEPTSPAARENAKVAKEHEDWGPHQVLHVGYEATAFVATAGRYVGGIKDLIDARRVTVEPWPLLRAEVEHLSLASWLLDNEITAESRVARFWMQRLCSAYRARWLAGATNASGSIVKQVKRTRQSIEDELRRRFPDANLPQWTKPEELPEWEVRGEHYTSTSQASRRFFKLNNMDAAGTYDILSTYSHPSTSLLAATTDKYDVGSRTEFHQRVNAIHMMRLAKYSATAFYKGAHMISSYFGLNPEALEKWADAADAVFH